VRRARTRMLSSPPPTAVIEHPNAHAQARENLPATFPSHSRVFFFLRKRVYNHHRVESYILIFFFETVALTKIPFCLYLARLTNESSCVDGQYLMHMWPKLAVDSYTLFLLDGGLI